MIVLRLLSYLPFPVLYLLSDFLYLFTRYVVRYRLKVVRKNLRNSFPELTKKELREIEKRFYRNLCDYGVETLKAFTISKEELAKRTTYKNVEILQEYKNKNMSVIILAAHQFNWEWLITAGNFSLPLPVDFVYQPVNNELFNRFSLRCRTRFGAFPIKRDEVAKVTIKRRNLLRSIAIVADQYPGHKTDKKYFTNFLHQPSVFFQGASQLAQLTQYAVVFSGVRKIRRGYYEITIEKLSEPPYQRDDFTMLERYVSAVEKMIREYPDGWLWSHNRWKKKHLQRDEPITPTSSS